MSNIKINYFYRDAGNYKNFGSIIFINPQNIELSALEDLIRSKLISHHWFYADQWQVPDLHFGTWDNKLDHSFHEFESVEYTDEPADAWADIALFINILKNAPPL
ncbi:hypothetical protein DIU31_025845 [Mucilaginibacter rubeus]|uniref:Uncharacterized protein n=1 Tax=Mucilaginibacter rubeus TaxID=2027860 RepID=A0AAE6JJI1_9SPHI|nr:MULTISPECIES: hypothetical protein [Mucilaginibacter]QEM06760.1 hypothetical protein DIU31_025845 [Mucilaginibacter rubeus]QEM19348.1 hypothetical protein DIU38_026130 [Mucilaginibacter gossypii]QTE44104.1 hypothetical protein J3L19_01595 [Mucilaginibacter rubeus]QTE50705.1 hypothetical protein J3L21_01575 [Mucilaginibacter rubeus]QTE55787.1 hypothetical protein J3L23_26810 [Mucilaginibacter rubeus]